MWDDKYGPDSLYVQIEQQKAKAVQEFESWKAQSWTNHYRQLDNQALNNTSSYDWFGSNNTNSSNTRNKSGWFW